MLPAEQHVRMRTLRAAVQRHSAQHWAASLLQAATTVHGQAAPLHLVSPPHHAPRSVHAHTMKGR
jgi:trehalose-6-phosphate synthase